jgi:hypothetical protein
MRFQAIAAAILMALACGTARAQSATASRAFQLRLGGFFPSGGDEFWDETEDVFTLRMSDFDGFVFGASFVGSVSNRVEIGGNLDFYRRTVRSSYSGIVDSAGFPILHDSRLTLTPLTVDVRLLPGGRHRIVRGGRAALKPVFYLGGGGGVNFWEYEEVGDFLDFEVDPQQPPIFYGRFLDDGAALELHALAGVEFPMSPGFNFVLEARYSWSDETLDGDFAGLGRIELGGLSTYAGASFRF